MAFVLLFSSTQPVHQNTQQIHADYGIHMSSRKRMIRSISSIRWMYLQFYGPEKGFGVEGVQFKGENPLKSTSI